jgi:hypothetical protein
MVSKNLYETFFCPTEHKKDSVKNRFFFQSEVPSLTILFKCEIENISNFVRFKNSLFPNTEK